MSDHRRNLRDVPWALATSAQGGVMVAGPTIIGLVLGYWLDSTFGTLPWISLVLTLIGAMLGPVFLYKWVTTVVKRRMDSRENQHEERPE